MKLVLKYMQPISNIRRKNAKRKENIIYLRFKLETSAWLPLFYCGIMVFKFVCHYIRQIVISNIIFYIQYVIFEKNSWPECYATEIKFRKKK